MAANNYLRISALALMALASLGLVGCVNTPVLTAQKCQELCARDGKTVKMYRVGAAIPIVKPDPNVHCECEAKPRD